LLKGIFKKFNVLSLKNVTFWFYHNFYAIYYAAYNFRIPINPVPHLAIDSETNLAASA